MWDPNTYACVQTLSGEHTANIYTLAAGHGTTLFSGAWDKTIKARTVLGLLIYTRFGNERNVQYKQ